MPSYAKENKLTNFLKVVKGLIVFLQLIKQVNDIYTSLAAGEVN